MAGVFGGIVICCGFDGGGTPGVFGGITFRVGFGGGTPGVLGGATFRVGLGGGMPGVFGGITLRDGFGGCPPLLSPFIVLGVGCPHSKSLPVLVSAPAPSYNRGMVSTLSAESGGGSPGVFGGATGAKAASAATRASRSTCSPIEYRTVIGGWVAALVCVGAVTMFVGREECCGACIFFFDRFFASTGCEGSSSSAS